MTPFAPFRPEPGTLPVEAARRAAESEAGPLLLDPGEPVPAEMGGAVLAALPAGRAGAPEEACRAADGSPAGVAGALRACLTSERHRRRLAEAAATALAAGLPGVCLDQPDEPLALGLLGAGFCADCQRAFLRELAREYGDQFQPLDFARMAAEALAQAPGALGHGLLPFGRDFMRFRTEALARAVAAQARDARDAARAAGKRLEVTARFQALGPAQIAAARHLDAAIFPATWPPAGTGLGLFRLARAALGRRPCAVIPPAELADGDLLPLAWVAAACGVEIAGPLPAGSTARALAAARRLFRSPGANGTAAPPEPLAECAVLYSAESDLWSGGRHREAVMLAVEALADLQVQAPVVLRVPDAPAGAVLVLSGAEALSPLEGQAVKRRLESGGTVLCLGEAGAVDVAGRPAPSWIPAGKPTGVKVEQGTLVTLPSPLPPQGSGLAAAAPLEPIERALSLLLGRGGRAVSVTSRVPMLAVAFRRREVLELHLAALRDETARGATLFLGIHVAGQARRARFRSAEGADERISMNPAGYAISTVLPSFRGYAVLTLGA